MIFLVDHQADLLARIDDHAAGALRFGVFAADELPLDQKLPIEPVQIADVDIRATRRTIREFSARGRGECVRSRRDLDPWPG